MAFSFIRIRIHHGMKCGTRWQIQWQEQQASACEVTPPKLSQTGVGERLLSPRGGEGGGGGEASEPVGGRGEASEPTGVGRHSHLNHYTVYHPTNDSTDSNFTDSNIFSNSVNAWGQST